MSKQLAFYIPDINTIRNFFDAISYKAIDQSDFSTWLRDNGFIKSKSLADGHAPSTIKCERIRIGNILSTKRAYDLELLDFFNANDITMVYGPSGCGKTKFMGGLSIAFASGNSFMDLKKSSPVPVLYLDGECGYDRFQEMITILSQNLLPQEKELLEKNINMCTPDESNNFLEKIEGIIELIKERGIKVIIIDNLLALAKKCCTNSAKPLFEFFYRLKNMGVNSIFVHHTDKGGTTYLGTTDLESLSQNIFELRDIHKLTAKSREELGISAISNVGKDSVTLSV